MKTLYYTPGELPTTDTAVLSRLARRAGFTNASAGSCVLEGQSILYMIYIADNSPATKEHVVAAINALTDIELAVFPASVDLVADGATTAMVTVSGPANTQARVSFSGSIPISPTNFTFDSNGLKPLVVGPFAKGLSMGQPVQVHISNIEKIYKPAILSVSCHA